MRPRQHKLGKTRQGKRSRPPREPTKKLPQEVRAGLPPIPLTIFQEVIAETQQLGGGQNQQEDLRQRNARFAAEAKREEIRGLRQEIVDLRNTLDSEPRNLKWKELKKELGLKLARLQYIATQK